MEAENEDVAMTLAEQEARGLVRAGFVVDVHRGCDLGIAIDDDERHAAPTERGHLVVRFVEPDDDESVDRCSCDRARQRAMRRGHGEEPDGALVGYLADALEERRKEWIGEHGRHGLRKQDAEYADAT